MDLLLLLLPELLLLFLLIMPRIRSSPNSSLPNPNAPPISSTTISTTTIHTNTTVDPAAAAVAGFFNNLLNKIPRKSPNSFTNPAR